MFERLSLRVRIFLFFAFLALATSALAIGGLSLGYFRLGEAHALSAFMIAGLVAVAAIIGLTTWVWVMFDENVAKPVERLAAGLRVRAHAGGDEEIIEDHAQYLGDLAPAASAVATSLTETRNAMALAVGRETARLTTEKARLEALLSEIPDGVLFCTPDHKLALYNGRVPEMLDNAEAVGLNRPLSELLKTAPILQAYGRLLSQSESAGTDILVTTRGGARLLEARMRLLRLEGQETDNPGYVLALRDVSKDLPVHAERAHLFEKMLTGVQNAPTLQTAQALGREIAAAKAPTDTSWWPMEILACTDLGTALSARLARKGVTLACELSSTALRCDGFAVTRLLERVALEWSNAGATSLRLTHEIQDKLILKLIAEGAEPSGLPDWLDTPLSPGQSGFSGRDVLVCHGTQLQRLAGPNPTLELALPLAQAPGLSAAQRVLYDFEVLDNPISETLGATALSALNYVVFDTETTGLNPAVDEICQIAAVRMVNGRVVSEERFDMLVNPGQPIPAASTAVHHITDVMVQDAEAVGPALMRFHTFAKGAVLIAHNAPFDMAFLRRRETEIGARFDQPILDTVLCSAILYGQSEDHTLDALCTRLGVQIPEQDRHTAIGDAIATAAAMSKMIPTLEASGMPTLSTLISAFDRHKRVIGHLN